MLAINQPNYEILSDNTNKSLDNWKLLLTNDHIQQINKKLANILNSKFIGQDVLIVCILKGAVYFFVDLTRLFNFSHSCYFIEASSYHNKQTQSETLEILSKIVPSKFAGKKVILLDELYDNGTTIQLVKEAIHTHALVPLDDIFTCTIFKKQKYSDGKPIGQNDSQPDLCGIIVPDVWLVGYGLDDQQKKRNWPYVYGVPKIAGIPESPDDQMFKDSEFYHNLYNNLAKSLFDETTTSDSSDYSSNDMTTNSSNTTTTDNSSTNLSDNSSDNSNTTSTDNSNTTSTDNSNITSNDYSSDN